MDCMVQVQARIVEVQRQLHDLEATLEMNPGQELSDDEARLVEQLENLKLEFGEMLYELRHKLNVHVTSDVIDDVRIEIPCFSGDGGILPIFLYGSEIWCLTTYGTTAPVRYYPSTAFVLLWSSVPCRHPSGQDHSRAFRACIRGPPKDW